ncbi:IclR family transcriptional regulator [Agromyces aerolatus]|uniref:IclR family transcriptional regulator n=1 Tax=Agromyces sp. LY-1074 TaxID=3074080 RepID=UPI0028652B26|nr:MULTISPECIES: IclR family transcriptional regulator [unclassified Agromyces]MDR5700928.1 IclR family transcriptional regulator [Agromyces sp. LY-1074]MDR5707411.1 IclR family transcriptional regulator [Agromyces sp. LY-1358]
MNVVIRTLNALTLIGESSEGLSLTEASERLGYPLATTHRLLKVLADEDFIRRDPATLEYHPGRRLLRLSSVTRRETLAATAEHNLRELSERFNETVMMTQLIDGRAVCVALVDSRRPLHLSVKIGQAVPLHAAASARVLYSDFDDSAIEDLLRDHTFERLMPGTPSNTDEVLVHVRNIRDYGYDVCDNEFDFDIWASAAPVRDASGAIVAAVTLTSSQERSQPQQRRFEIIQAVTRTADDITLAIGGTPAPPASGTAIA